MKFNEKNFNFCLKHTTLENKLICTTEECAELQQVCTKWLRGRGANLRDRIIEEMSDVIVNIYLLMYHLEIDPSEIHTIADIKLKRFKERLKRGENP